MRCVYYIYNYEYLAIINVTLTPTAHNVVYFLPNGPNTFQAVVAVGGNETYAIFLYADGLMQWTYDHDTTGFNFPAKRAFSIHYFPLAGDYVSVTFMTNVNCPGMSIGF